MAVNEIFWFKNQEITWLQQLQYISIEDVCNKAINSFTNIVFFFILTALVVRRCAEF